VLTVLYYPNYSRGCRGVYTPLDEIGWAGGVLIAPTYKYSKVLNSTFQIKFLKHAALKALLKGAKHLLTQ
jgi:hypothetical protein